MGLRAGFASDRGLVRSVNEDTYFLRQGLYAVCDGMGGARGGEVASQMACFGLHGLDPATAGQRELRQAVAAANQDIVRRSADEDHLMGMGTTLTAVLIRENKLTLAHIGDSRAYLLREGDLNQLTEDHSWVGELVRRGDLTPAQAAIHPHRSVITRALGTDGEVEPDVIEMDLAVGDRIMLCSDGLTGMVADTDILEIMAAGEDAQKTAEMLVKAALLGGGEDNVTVIVVDVTAEDDSSDAAGGTGSFASQILFGPSDRGNVTGPSHRGRGAATVRERFGRRNTPPPARPVSQPVFVDEIPRPMVAPPLDPFQGEAPAAEIQPASEVSAGVGGESPTDKLQRDEESTVAEPAVTAASQEEQAVPKRRPPRLRMAIVLVLILVLALAIAIGGFAFYNSTIYYVGTYADGTVALYRGLPGSVLGIELSSVVQLGGAKYESLSAYDKRQVDSHRLVSEEEGRTLLETLGPQL
jgi:serine/threonine protein phosphatase PrpC